MSRTTYPQNLDLQRLLFSSGMLSAPPTLQQSQLDLDAALLSAQREWELQTGYTPFLAATQTRFYDPPGPEHGPVGIFYGVNNMGGSRKLFLYTGLQSVSALQVGRATNLFSGTGTVSGTVSSGVFTGTLTADLGSGTASVSGTGTITGTGSATLSFTVIGTGNTTFSITGTTTADPTGTCTGTVTLTGTTLTAGTTLVQNINYWLRPTTAPNGNRPYTFIEFAYPQWGNPQSISIAGSFGFAATVPDDAWQAILMRAGIFVVPHLQQLLTGGVLEWTEADVSEKYNAKPFQPIIDAWQMAWDSTICRYQRVNMI